MSEGCTELIDQLRSALNIESSETAYQEMFEHWLTLEEWVLSTQAVPLIVGSAPESWPGYLSSHGFVDVNSQLCAMLARELNCTETESVSAMRVYSWSRSRRVKLPEVLESLMSFVQQALPAVAVDHTQSAERVGLEAQEREVILGASLALVTKFPHQCRDENGFYDAAKIAALVIEKGALWFPHSRPELSPAAIEKLLDQYLS